MSRGGDRLFFSRVYRPGEGTDNEACRARRGALKIPLTQVESLQEEDDRSRHYQNRHRERGALIYSPFVGALRPGHSIRLTNTLSRSTPPIVGLLHVLLGLLGLEWPTRVGR